MDWDLIGLIFNIVMFVAICIVSYFALAKTKKQTPITKGDVFGKNTERDLMRLEREINRLNKNISLTRNRLMPFKEIKFYVYILLDDKLNILGCYFEKELAEYVAQPKCAEEEKVTRFVKEIEVRNGI